MNTASDPDVEALRRDLISAGLDPTGLDLATLVGVRMETESAITKHRDEPEYAAATPAFNPPLVAEVRR
jgi:hypothetical protein